LTQWSAHLEDCTTDSEREKLRVVELAEEELRVNVGKGYSKAFTVLEVLFSHKSEIFYV
jgi:hypothetical protein